MENILLDLPPMERSELERLANALVQKQCDIIDTSGSSGSSSSGTGNTESFETIFWQAYNVRTCSGNGGSLTETLPSSSSPSTQVEWIHSKIHDYQERYRTKGVTARCTVTEQADKEAATMTAAAQGGAAAAAAAVVLVVHTYAEHLDAANCSSGCWVGTWTMELLSEKDANLSGRVQFGAHHAEGQGVNVQTRIVCNFNAVLRVSTEEEMVNSMVAKFEKNTMSYAEQLATKLVEQIALYESQLYEALQEQNGEEQTYAANVEEGLRKLRRILPITKTRFKWDSAAQKNVKLLNARSSK
jgi:F-actin capping protein alpha subunit